MNLDERSAGALAEAVAARAGTIAHVDLGVAPALPVPAHRARPRRGLRARGRWPRTCTGGPRCVHPVRFAPPMLAGMGATFALVGHSERRRMFSDDDAAVARKAAAALRHGSRADRLRRRNRSGARRGQTLEVVARQVHHGLSAVPSDAAAAVTLAYEPVWAIGTGRVPTTEQVREVHAFVRARLAETFGAETAAAIRVLYGGSVTRITPASCSGSSTWTGRSSAERRSTPNSFSASHPRPRRGEERCADLPLRRGPC